MKTPHDNNGADGSVHTLGIATAAVTKVLTGKWERRKSESLPEELVPEWDVGLTVDSLHGGRELVSFQMAGGKNSNIYPARAGVCSYAKSGRGMASWLTERKTGGITQTLPSLYMLEQSRDNIDIALSAREMGIAAIPMVGKTPAVKWKRFQTELPTPAELRAWFSGETRRNIAIVTTGMVVFDVDDPAKAELVIRECGDTPHKLKTPRGLHLGYRKRKGAVLGNQVKIKGMPIDIRTDGGLEMIPNSQTEFGRYEWIGGLHPVAELPIAKIGWTRERVRQTVQRTEAIEIVDMDRMTRRAAAWLEVVARENPAVSGEGGHNATFRVACKLTHYFGLDRETAIWLLMTIYNPRCRPEWTRKEIEDKVDDAIRKLRR
jgi:hypothetical protein